MNGSKLSAAGFCQHHKAFLGAKMPYAHFHTANELYYLISGKTKYFISGELYILEPGNFVFVHSGEYHRTECIGDTPTERLLFTFEDDFVGADYMPFVDELTKDRLAVLPQSALNKFRSIFSKIEYESENNEVNSAEMQQLYLRQMLILISRYRLHDQPPELVGTPKIIQDAADFIRANYAADLSLNMLAKKYAISPAHFTKMFKKVTGVCLSEYITVCRITAAQKLLSDTDLTVTEIAMKCGYNNSNYFAHVFHSITGELPKKYQMQFR